MIKDSLPGRLDDFAVGMLACHWFVHGWKQDWLEKCAVPLFGASIMVLAAGCCLSDYVFLHFAPGQLEPFINTIVQLGTGMLCLSLLYMKANGLRYLFAIQLSGMMCYSLYVWHGNLRWFFVMDYTALRICSYLVFLFLFSFLTYRHIEFGDRKLKDILPE
jgi:peptidoglycan/LPS O-acetylase OafA/YrhL